MLGLMQQRTLTLPILLDNLQTRFSHKTVATRTATRNIRSPYHIVAQRIRRLSAVLDELAVPIDARVASFGWNSQRHLELYMAVPCAQRILHTINHRLFADDIVYIINDAQDDVVFVDRSLFDVVWPLIDRCPTVRHVIVLDDDSPDGRPNIATDSRVLDYETLLASVAPREVFSITDERQAAALCYTSGTTGRPKGVLYDHRSIILHAMTLLMADSFALSDHDTVMPIVPMFHVNAWGLPYAAMMAGANLVLPGDQTQPHQLAAAMTEEAVTFAAAVPTIWQGVLTHLPERGLPHMRRIVSGGAPLPTELSQRYRDTVGLPLTSSWGMTETSPLVCSAHVPSGVVPNTDAELIGLLAQPGPTTPLVSVRLQDEDGQLVAHDGISVGELQVAGPTIAGGYYGGARPVAGFTSDGWLRTGDVATIDRHGILRIVDRKKDLIKSGGEWISSAEVENAIATHPDVAEVAVVATHDERWGERPVACIVTTPGAEVSPAVIRDHLRGRIANWWIPDTILFMDTLPRTGTGKVAKQNLRGCISASQGHG
jgi:fatty-acyl-CoA synthase